MALGHSLQTLQQFRAKNLPGHSSQRFWVRRVQESETLGMRQSSCPSAWPCPHPSVTSSLGVCLRFLGVCYYNATTLKTLPLERRAPLAAVCIVWTCWNLTFLKALKEGKYKHQKSRGSRLSSVYMGLYSKFSATCKWQLKRKASLPFL